MKIMWEQKQSLITGPLNVNDGMCDLGTHDTIGK